MNKLLISLLLLSALTLVACSSTAPPAGSVQPPPINASNLTGPQTVEVNMTASQYSFAPSEIRVNQGDTLVIKVRSVDVEHGLSIPKLGVSVNLKPNVEQTVTIKADAKGTFPFTCSVFCGSGHSQMKGSIIVE